MVSNSFKFWSSSEKLLPSQGLSFGNWFRFGIWFQVGEICGLISKLRGQQIFYLYALSFLYYNVQNIQVAGFLF